MRISDWSSDVCSSDLLSARAPAGSKTAGSTDFGGEGEYRPAACERGVERRNAARLARIRRPADPRRTALALCADRAHARLLFLCLLSRHPRIPDRIVAGAGHGGGDRVRRRSEEHTSELQSLMRISYAVFCLKKKNKEQ